MKIGIILGSHRQNSQSRKVGEHIRKLIETTYASASVYVLDLAGNPLPLWDEGVWENSDEWLGLWSPVSANLEACDGFVVISPEWSGMVPAGLKNFFLLCSGELAHKPALIVSVSASSGGSYPVTELRISSYKNTRICYLPEHVIVRNVNDVLNSFSTEELSKEDEYTRTRLAYGVSLLVDYTKALGSVRTGDAYRNAPPSVRYGM